MLWPKDPGIGSEAERRILARASLTAVTTTAFLGCGATCKRGTGGWQHFSCDQSACPLSLGGTIRCFWEIWGAHQHDYPDDQKNPLPFLPLPFLSYSFMWKWISSPFLKFKDLASGRGKNVERGEIWKQKWGSQGPCCFKHLNQAGLPFFLEHLKWEVG